MNLPLLIAQGGGLILPQQISERPGIRAAPGWTMESYQERRHCLVIMHVDAVVNFL